MNKKNLIIILVVVILAIVVFFPVRYLVNVRKYKKMVSEIVISDVDLSKIQDGVYGGSCDVIFIAADVSVSVEKNKIKDIKLIRHKNERGQRAEEIVNRVLNSQSLKVDTISGATNSSKVILKAIENALTTAPENNA
ncbi:MAG: FMN-binding protein [Bacillota bacterium]